MSSRSARMWKSRSPGVDGAVCTGPRIGANGCRSTGRRPGDRRSHNARPDPDDARQPPAQVAEADVLDEVADRARARHGCRRARRRPRRPPCTRNIAARDSGASTLCASIGTRSHAPCSMAPMFSRPASAGRGVSPRAPRGADDRGTLRAPPTPPRVRAGRAAGSCRPTGSPAPSRARLRSASSAPGTRRAARRCRPRSARPGRTGRLPPATRQLIGRPRRAGLRRQRRVVDHFGLRVALVDAPSAPTMPGPAPAGLLVSSGGSGSRRRRRGIPAHGSFRGAR